MRLLPLLLLLPLLTGYRTYLPASAEPPTLSPGLPITTSPSSTLPWPTLTICPWISFPRICRLPWF